MCIISYKTIFNRKFLPEELLNIIYDRIDSPARIPAVIDDWIG